MTDAYAKRQPGMTWIFWGDGKGKSTAALGGALRALGHGLRVHMVQFLKGGPVGPSQPLGELEALRLVPGFTVEQFNAEEWVLGELSAEQSAELERAFSASREALSSGWYDLVILDEILYAVPLGGISSEAILALLDAKAQRTDVILTGGWSELPELIRRADLVTEMKKVKHPFDLGIAPRQGVEY